MKEEIKRGREVEPEPMPDITPQMIEKTMNTLESEGMLHRTESGVYVPTEGGWKLLAEIKPTKEEVIAYGHPNVTATHTTTIEITKAGEMGEEADCIIAVKADKGCNDISKEMKDALKEGAKIEITIEAKGATDKVVAYGSPALELSHPEDMVIRKSDFIDDRTLAILADKAANELNQDLIEKLRDPKTQVKITLEIKS